MIAGAFSSTSGKADTVLTTSGDVLYYTSSRQRLPIGDEGQVLTVSGSDLPAWAAASGGANTALSNLSSVAVNATIDMNTNTLEQIKYADLKDYTTLTIASGEVTSTQSYHVIDTEGAASTDDLNSCAGYDRGTLMYQRQSNDARDITWVDDSGGSNRFIIGGNVTMTNTYDTITLLQHKGNGTGAIWIGISSRDNAA